MNLPKLNSKSDKITKRVTKLKSFYPYHNKDTLNLLYKIGISNRPLSSTEIYEELGKTKQVYEIIERLTPTLGKDEFLFVFDLHYIKKNIKKIILKLNKISSNLNWKSDLSTYDHIYEYENITFKMKDDEILYIHDSSSNKSLLVFINKNSKTGFLYIYENNPEIDKEIPDPKWSFNLFLKKKRNEFQIYCKLLNTSYLSNNIRFLKVSLKDKEQKNIDKIKEIGSNNNFESRMSILEKHNLIRNNPRNWRYSLTLHGLFLYLYLEYFFHSDNCVKRSEKRIKDVISNPKIIEIVPFLNDWEFFDSFKKNVKTNSFDVVKTLLKISKEFIDQLETKDIFALFVRGQESTTRFLLLRITERYVYYFLKSFDSDYGMYASYKNTIHHQKFCEFYLKNLGYIKEELKKELKLINDLYDEYNESYEKIINNN